MTAHELSPQEILSNLEYDRMRLGAKMENMIKNGCTIEEAKRWGQNETNRLDKEEAEAIEAIKWAEYEARGGNRGKPVFPLTKLFSTEEPTDSNPF